MRTKKGRSGPAVRAQDIEVRTSRRVTFSGRGQHKARPGSTKPRLVKQIGSDWASRQQEDAVKEQITS